jgi:hypothetical protein
VIAEWESQEAFRTFASDAAFGQSHSDREEATSGTIRHLFDAVSLIIRISGSRVIPSVAQSLESTGPLAGPVDLTCQCLWATAIPSNSNLVSFRSGFKS